MISEYCAPCRPMPPSQLIDEDEEEEDVEIDEDEDEDDEDEDAEDVGKKKVKEEQEQALIAASLDRAAMPMSVEPPEAGNKLQDYLKNSLDLVRQALAAIRGRLH